MSTTGTLNLEKQLLFLIGFFMILYMRETLVIPTKAESVLSGIFLVKNVQIAPSDKVITLLEVTGVWAVAVQLYRVHPYFCLDLLVPFSIGI